MFKVLSSILLSAVLIGGSASAACTNSATDFATATCPSSVAGIANCYSAHDNQGAWVLAVVPLQWNNTLIVHAHGGPSLGDPELGQAVEDMDRFNVFVRNGYAWVSSTYRRGGYGVRMAAADVDNSRDLFWRACGKPARTILHGQSYGGNVAAKVAELYALDLEAAPNYDGVMLTSGVLAGGTRAYGFRVDLRAVYQYYCKNMPKPTEASYPAWQGLRANSTLTHAGLASRIEACTGLSLSPAARTPAQARNLQNILAVTGIAEKHLDSHMQWATFTLADLVHKRLGGLNAFDNAQKIYQGSDDDAALNSGVERFTANPRARAKLAYDADLSGLIVLPTITMHATLDPIIPFSVEADYARVVQAAGRSDLLLQTATSERGHSMLAETQYLALLTSLTDWIASGQRPQPEDIATRCQQLELAVPGGCHFVSPATGAAQSP